MAKGSISSSRAEAEDRRKEQETKQRESRDADNHIRSEGLCINAYEMLIG